MVSIVIVNYNQKNLLKLCLKNIYKANIDLDFEIIIVDNNSKDSSREYLSNLSKKEISVIQNNKNLGYAKANNQAIRQAGGDYILMLNPDVIIQKGVVEKLQNFLKENEKVAMVGPQILNPDKTIQNSCCRFPKIYTPALRRTFLGKLPILKKEIDRYLMKDFNHKSKRSVDWMIGACLMLKRDVLKEIGFLDERYFLYFEDIDLARKIKKVGKKIYYLPQAKVIHFHQRLSAHKRFCSKVVLTHILSGIKYFLKWGID